MNQRILKIVSVIEKTDVFADIGCDHGYASLYMLQSGKCNKVIFTDISSKCLEKAKTLLKDYVSCGKALPLVTDGLNGVDGVDTALIAGMGGEEIVKVLKAKTPLPNTLVLQPMKNTPKVREYLLNNGYKINSDFIFYSDKKYYDLIVAEKGNDYYSESETEFGRDNLKNKQADFVNYIKQEIKKLQNYKENPNTTEKAVKEIDSKIKKLQEVL